MWIIPFMKTRPEIDHRELQFTSHGSSTFSWTPLQVVVDPWGRYKPLWESMETMNTKALKTAATHEMIDNVHKVVTETNVWFWTESIDSWLFVYSKVEWARSSLFSNRWIKENRLNLSKLSFDCQQCNNYFLCCTTEECDDDLGVVDEEGKWVKIWKHSQTIGWL